MKLSKTSLIAAIALGTTAIVALPSAAGNYGKKAETATMQKDDIVTLAAGTEDLSTLVTAVKAAGLVETLQGDGPFTVFAPVNTAFEKLPEGTVASLVEPENQDKLTSILTYHVVAGKVKAKDVLALIEAGDGTATVETVQGGTLTATLKDGQVVLMDEAGGMSTVTATDVKASNGVVHLIDTVVMPG